MPMRQPDVTETHPPNLKLKKISANYYQSQDEARPSTEPNGTDFPERYLASSQVAAASLRDHEESEEFSLQICSLCIADEANAVLMSCGHGGLCKACGVVLMAGPTGCYLCRSPIDYIYEISSYSKVQSKVELSRQSFA